MKRAFWPWGRQLRRRILVVALAGAGILACGAAPAPATTGPHAAAKPAPAAAVLRRAAVLPLCLGPLIVPGAAASTAPCAPLVAGRRALARIGPTRRVDQEGPTQPAHGVPLGHAILIAVAAAAVTGLIVYLAVRQSGTRPAAQQCEFGTYVSGGCISPPPQ